MPRSGPNTIFHLGDRGQTQGRNYSKSQGLSHGAGAEPEAASNGGEGLDRDESPANPRLP